MLLLLKLKGQPGGLVRAEEQLREVGDDEGDEDNDNDDIGQVD